MESTKTKQRKVIEAHEKQLPCELIEEILSHVSPTSLVRFRIVCKEWKAIVHDKKFINNHKETFRFILKSKSKIYSVSIDPKIVVRELTLNISGLETHKPKALVHCDEFVLCNMDNKTLVWNPWLKQSTWISEPSFTYQLIGWSSDRRSDQDSVYKTVWLNTVGSYSTRWKMYDLSSDTWKDVGAGSGSNHQKETPRLTLHTLSGVSLNGSLFAIAFYKASDPLYGLVRFDFSIERFIKFCDLPCGTSHYRDALVLRVFKGDRFSLLKQCHLTKKIVVWVTKNKVNVKDGNDVVWVNFMTLSIPNYPSLVQSEPKSQQPSYYIDDKKLVVCCCDENGKAWIYVLGENKLISKVQLDSVVESWPLHCTYFPSLVPVPRGQRVEENLQV